MKRLKAILIIIFGLIVFLLIFPEHKFWQKYFKFPVIEESQQKEQILMNPKLIDNVILENLEIEAQKYKFEKGKVFKNSQEITDDQQIQKVRSLVFFYQMTKEDPLFTFPNFNLEDFKKTLSGLKYSQEKYNASIGKNEKFFPISFLELIPSVYSKEDEFSKNPSDNTAEKLLSAYEETARAYAEEAKEFTDTLNSNKDKIADTNYIAINSTTSKKVIFSDLEKLEQNSTALLSEIESRKNCLEKALSCKRPLSNKETPATSELEKTPDDKPLPLNDLFPRSNPTTKRARLSRLSALKGPYFVPTACFGWGENFTQKENLFYLLPRSLVLTETNLDIPDAIFKLATDNFYRKVARVDFEADFKTNLPFTYQNEDNFYVCRDATYQADISTLDFFVQKYKDNKLFASIDIKKLPANQTDFFEKARKLEEDFFASTPKSWTDLETLSGYYAYAAKTLDAENYKSAKDNFLTAYLTINRRLADFTQIVNHGIRTFLTLPVKEKGHPQVTTNPQFFYSQVYLTRNLWNVLYFPFSPSFWRGPSLDYLEKIEVKSVGPDGPYLNSKFAAEKFSQKQIEQMHNEGWEYSENMRTLVKP